MLHFGRHKKKLADDSTLRGIEDRHVYRMSKRVFDVAFSAFAIVGTSPVLLAAAIAIKADDPSAPVVFAQRRVGMHGAMFTMHKLRTMVADAEQHLDELRPLNEKDGPVFKIKDDPRVTRPGRFLRRTSIDELPQFWDVFLGNMSVVGPRPGLPGEVAKYDDRARQRLLVKPGVTCFWQASPNRDDLSFEEWMELDLRYVRECGPLVDLLLVVRTIRAVVLMQGN